MKKYTIQQQVNRLCGSFIRSIRFIGHGSGPSLVDVIHEITSSEWQKTITENDDQINQAEDCKYYLEQVEEWFINSYTDCHRPADLKAIVNIRKLKRIFTDYQRTYKILIAANEERESAEENKP